MRPEYLSKGEVASLVFFIGALIGGFIRICEIGYSLGLLVGQFILETIS